MRNEPWQARSILGKLKTIDWGNLMKNAVARELVRSAQSAPARGDKRPDCSEELPEVTAARRFQEYIEEYAQTASIDPDEAPF